MLRVLLILAFAFVGCTKKTAQPANTTATAATISPLLKIQTLNDSCLDLETIVHQMDDLNFAFPGFVYTQNFEILSGSPRDSFRDTLIARSFRSEAKSINWLSDLRAVKQDGCTQVSMPDAGGMTLVYRITASSPNHLELDLDTDALNNALAALPELQRDDIRAFPTVKKWVVKALGPTRVELTSVYQSIPVECPKVDSLEVREEQVFNWSADAGQVDKTARLNPAYWENLNRVLTQAGTPAPAVSPDATDGLVHLDEAVIQSVRNILQARIYAPCN